MRLIVVRHGRTDWNAMRKIQGHADTSINEEGIKQAKELAEKFKDIKFDVVISSPLKRALETATIICNGKYDIITDERIMERDFGEFEGMIKDEFRNANDVADFWGYERNMKYKKAENIRDFYKRVYDFLDEIKEKYKDKTVLVVTHGGVGIPIRGYFEGIPTDDDIRKGDFKNGEFKEYKL